MNDAQNGATPLKRGVGLTGVVSLGIGTAVGVSIFSVLTPAVQLAGPAMLLSMVIAMVPMIVFALVYAFMGSADPVTGASFEWPRRYVTPFAGFFVSWLRIAGSTAALIVLTMVLVSYVGQILHVPQRPVMFAIFAFIFVVNMIGISAAALSQTIMLVVLLATCAIYTLGGIPHVSAEHFQPFLVHGWAGVLAAIPLMISLFLGIESAVEVGGEIRRPTKTIPFGISISVVLTAAIYFCVAVVTIGILGTTDLADSAAPLLDGATISLGSAGRLLILVTAVVAIGSSINSTFIILTRFLLAMSRAGMLPEVLGQVHAGSGVPRPAVVLAFGLCCLGLFMPQNLVFLFLAVNIPTILKYAAICLASIGLMKRSPELYEAASFRLPVRMVYALAILGVVLGAIIILLGLSADWRPYVALGVWAGLGIAYYFLLVRHTGRVPGSPEMDPPGAGMDIPQGPARE